MFSFKNNVNCTMLWLLAMNHKKTTVMRKFKLLCFAVVISVGLNAQDYRYVLNVAEDATKIESVVYGNAPYLNSPFYDETDTYNADMLMDIYLPEGDTMTNRPAIIFAHGGGFVDGNRNHDDMVAFCDSMARKGYVTATIDYREGVWTTSEAELHYTRAVYRGMQDGRTAVRFLRANAATYGIDATKVYFVGSSAGAFIGLQNIYMDEPSEKPASAGETTYGTMPQITAPDLGDYDIGTNLGYNGEPDAVVGLWGAIAHPDLITVDNDQPVFLVHGTADAIVPFDIGSPFQVSSFPETYGSNQVNIKLDALGLTEKDTYFVVGEEHEFYGVTNGMWDNGYSGNAYWDTVVNMTTHFLYQVHKPTADFDFAADFLNVDFNDLSTDASDWLWDFGDGNTSTAQNPDHTYSAEGDYQVLLYVENDIASWDTISQVISVSGPTLPDPVEPAVGNGTFDNPYQIEILENLLWIAQNDTAWDAHFVQVANIDASATTNWTSASGEGFPPIGDNSVPFTGAYNGNGYMISNLYINKESDYVALFGKLGNDDGTGMLTNMTLENVDINAPLGGDWWCTGSLAGWNLGGTIDSCHTSGLVNGEHYAGGLLGVNEGGTITNSTTSCTLTGDDYVGGFVGENKPGSLLDGDITDCAATGHVTTIGNSAYVGGFAGFNAGNINGCYAKGNVAADEQVGGFVGEFSNNGNDPVISNCYAWGNVTRETGATSEQIGAFIGHNTDNGNAPNLIEHAYAIGMVIYEDATNPTDKGFVGVETGTQNYTANFFDTETSGQTSAVGATGQTTAAMQTMSTFTGAGWDFMEETTNGTDDYWGINSSDNDAYPFLRWQGYYLQTEVTEWPTASEIQCGQTLDEAALSGGAANVSGNFLWLYPDSIPPFGTGDYEVVFVPDDDVNYGTVQGMISLTVIDSIAPVITCAGDQVIDLDEGQNGYTVNGNEFDPTAEDECGIFTLLNDYNSSATLDGEQLTPGTYTINWTVADESGNEDTCSVVLTVNAYTGIRSNAANDIVLYPNPFNDIITLQTDLQIKYVRVTNLQGKIMAVHIDQNRIDMNALPRGMYLVHLIDKGGSHYVQKIVKQ